MVNYFEAHWKPFLQGRFKKRPTEKQVTNEAKDATKHIESFDRKFKLPERIMPDKLKSFTKPLLEEARALNDQLKARVI